MLGPRRQRSQGTSAPGKSGPPGIKGIKDEPGLEEMKG